MSQHQPNVFIYSRISPRPMVLALTLLLSALLVTCAPDDTANEPPAADNSMVSDPTAELQMRFLQASPGDVITQIGRAHV